MTVRATRMNCKSSSVFWWVKHRMNLWRSSSLLIQTIMRTITYPIDYKQTTLMKYSCRLPYIERCCWVAKRLELLTQLVRNAQIIINWNQVNQKPRHESINTANIWSRWLNVCCMKASFLHGDDDQSFVYPLAGQCCYIIYSWVICIRQKIWMIHSYNRTTD